MKQHYLPECYLKEFINESKKINTLDLDRLNKYKKNVFDEPKFSPWSVAHRTQKGG